MTVFGKACHITGRECVPGMCKSWCSPPPAGWISSVLKFKIVFIVQAAPILERPEFLKIAALLRQF